MKAARTERVQFPGLQGQNLAARLDLPGGNPCGYALFAHCFSCSKDVLTAVRISNALAERGIATLRFDFTGLGSSQGEFSNTNFSSNVEDLLQAAQFLRQHYQPPTLLIGHSLGGAAILTAAGSIAEVKAVATLNAPSDPAHVSHLFEGVLEDIEQQGEVQVKLAGRAFRIKRQFLEDIREQNLLKKVKALRKPLMIFHSPIDKIVSIEHAAHIYGAAKHPKNFISLDDADHMVSRESDAHFVASVLTAWASRYMDQPQNVQSDKEARTVSVGETEESPFSQRIIIGPHILKADEPVSYGGKDLGPSPYDYLLTGLGACTAMTVRMYAERKKLPLDQVTVELKHEKIHANDCENCETKSGKVDFIQRQIRLQGRLDNDQKNKLLEIADKCPVHRTLHAEVSVKTQLVDD